jgi:hypothetical protein
MNLGGRFLRPATGTKDMGPVAQGDREVIVRQLLDEDLSLRSIERQIDMTRSSLLHQLDTLETTLAGTDTENGRDLRHLATVVEHTAHLMHETVELLQLRRVLAEAGQAAAPLVDRIDLGLT